MNSLMRLMTLFALLPLAASMAAAQTSPADQSTTPTCSRYGFLGTSEASPPDGAVYRVGEPVIFEPDPEFATREFCTVSQLPGFEGGPISSISRSIDQFGVDGRPIAGVVGFADTHEVLHFNVPGTVRIELRADGSFPTPRTGRKINTITIIDDGPGPFPEPVSAPPGEKRPRIEARRWRGDPQVPITYAVLTEDNSFSQLPWTEIKNTGDAPLVIDRIMHWIGVHHTTVYPVESSVNARL